MNFPRFKSSLWLLLILLINGNQAAQPQGLPAEQILEWTGERLGISQRLFVSQKTTCYFPNPAEPIILNESLMYRFPDRFRAEMITGSGSRVYIFSAGKALTLINDKPSTTFKSGFFDFKQMLLFRTPAGLRQCLRDFGIDDRFVSLGRFNQQTAYVIGADFPDLSASQFWIDKDAGLPFRLILVSPASAHSPAQAIEFRYLDWRDVNGVQYPFGVEIYENQTLTMLMIVKQIVINPTFSDNLFDIEAIRNQAEAIAPTSSDEGETDVLDEVRKIIEDFHKRFEFDESD